MRQSRYLNVLLTINALLLTVLTWSHLTGGPAWSPRAAAQTPPERAGIPNAGQQRQQTVDELRGIRVSVDALRKTMEGGKMKIVIGNLDELRAVTKSDDKPKEDRNGN